MSVVAISPQKRHDEGRAGAAPPLGADAAARAGVQVDCACPDFCEMDHAND